MIPGITEALLARAIQTPRMVEAGRDYWRRGLVSDLSIDRDLAVVRASVQGSARTPYRVELRFSPRGGLAATCSCPVAMGCKHAAATLFALQRADGPGRSDSRSPLPTHAAWHGGGRPSPASNALPPALSQWLTTMRPLVEQAHGDRRPRSRALLYVVRAQALRASTRLSKKRALASLAPRGCAVRLLVEAYDVAFDGDGRPIGNGTKIPSGGIYGMSDVSVLATDEDRLLLRRLQLRIRDTDHEGCLTGVGGADLFARIIATGRARWATVQGPMVSVQPGSRAEFAWADEDLGKTRLFVKGVPEGNAVALVAPPVSIDPLTGAVASLEFGIPPAMAEHLLRLPPIDPETVPELAARWHEIVPSNVPAPIVPEVRDLGSVSPIPVLSVRTDRVEIEDSDYGRYRYGHKTRIECAVTCASNCRSRGRSTAYSGSRQRKAASHWACSRARTPAMSRVNSISA